jgi:hypothetical protein
MAAQSKPEIARVSKPNRSPPEHCTVGDCQRPFYARMMCHAHYERFRLGRKTTCRIGEGPIEEFWTKTILAHDSDECLPWPFALGDKGYGVWSRNRSTSTANHIVCERTYGLAPTEQHQSAHSCGNRKCVNPRHLRWATPVENEQDKILHGTANYYGAVRFSDEVMSSVIAAHSRGGKTIRGLASEYGISPSHVCRIVNGKARRCAT